MFETDSLSDINFVLEFNLPKEIYDNQEPIKLQVHHVDVPIVEIPACPIGYKSIPIRTPGEIHCIERYKHIKEVLPFINKWVNSVYCTYNKLHSGRSDLLVEAKLYAYKNDNSLFKKWDLVELYPLFNPNSKYTNDNVELIFKFENIAEVDSKSVYDISKYIKEYKDRENKCEFCAYHNTQFGRCSVCKDHDWFAQTFTLKEYIINRVSEDSEKEFKESDEAVQLKSKIDLRKNVYNDFNKYAENQKEFLDKELEDRRAELFSLESDYNRKMERHIKDNISKAIKSLNPTTR